jgi:hypothetical protein
MNRLGWVLLLLPLASCALDAAGEGQETTAPPEEEGEQPLDFTPVAPSVPQPGVVRSALPATAERTVGPRNPTPDPWASVDPAKPTPDPWSPEEEADEE